MLGNVNQKKKMKSEIYEKYGKFFHKVEINIEKNIPMYIKSFNLGFGFEKKSEKNVKNKFMVWWSVVLW